MTGSEIYETVKKAKLKAKVGGLSTSEMIQSLDRREDASAALLALYCNADDNAERKVSLLLDGLSMPGPAERVRLKHAASILGISTRTIIRKIKNGDIPCAVTPGGKRYITGESLRMIIQSTGAKGKG